MARSYWASDYAGFDSKHLSAYYGYEQTMQVGNEEEWCFIAVRVGKEIMRIPASKLKGNPSDDCQAMLLAGLAQLFDEYKLA